MTDAFTSDEPLQKSDTLKYVVSYDFKNSPKRPSSVSLASEGEVQRKCQHVRKLKSLFFLRKHFF